MSELHGIIDHVPPTTPLIGRERDLRAVRSALAECATGLTRVVVISGEAGIGKSRLVDEFLAQPGAPTTVTRGQSIDLDDDAPPYAPIISALRGLERQVGAEVFREATGAGLLALSLLLPELALSDRGEASAFPRSDADAGRLLDTIAGLLERLGRIQPVTFVVEDLHWADAATVATLRFLTRVLTDARVLFVLTVRGDEVRRGGAVRSWLVELERIRRVERLELDRLSEPEVRAMVQGIVDEQPTAGFIDDVFRRAEGVPFFVEELAGCRDNLSAGDYPDTLREILLARYERVSEDARRMLRLMAAGGARVDYALLAAVTDGSSERLEADAREATDAGVLLNDGPALAFRHALVRDAIHDELLPGERARFHAAYAEALEAREGADLADGIEVSYHWMSAHNLPRAFNASVVAMRQAESAHAFEAAARMGQRALELWPQVPQAVAESGLRRERVLADTAISLRNAGESERAVDIIDEALAGAGQLEPWEHANMLRNKASFLANLGRVGSIELLEQALELVADEESSPMRSVLLGELAARQMLDGELERAAETADRAYADAERVGSRRRMSVAVNIRGVCRVRSGDADRGLADLELAGELAQPGDSSRLRYWLNLSDALHFLGRYRDAVRLAEEGARIAEESGLERTTGAVLVANIVAPLFDLGNMDQAAALLDRALEVDAPIGFSAPLKLIKLRSTLWAGRTERAAELLREWRRGLERQRRIDVLVSCDLSLVASEIALALGDVVGAWTALAACREVRVPERMLLVVQAARCVRAAAERGIELTDEHGGQASLAELATRIEAELDRASGWPLAPLYSAVGHAELSEVLPARAAPDVAWSTALVALEDDGRTPVLLVSHVRLQLTLALVSRGRRPDAREQLRQTRAEAERLGLGLILRELDDLERRAGLGAPVSVGSEDVAPATDLTGRELQVITLVAQGMTNRQVAERLFISPKTASVHVSNILRKLGATSRTEAGYLLRQRGIDVL